MARVLVVDDEEMVRLSVALILRSKGWEAEQASDGVEALAQARQHPPDLIVCDLNMPVMDGFQTLAEVRQDPRLKSIPFLVITGQTGNNNEQRALDQGAQAVLLKPFSVDSLVQLVEVHLGKSPR